MVCLIYQGAKGAGKTTEQENQDLLTKALTHYAQFEIPLINSEGFLSTKDTKNLCMEIRVALEILFGSHMRKNEPFCGIVYCDPDYPMYFSSKPFTNHPAQ